MDEQLRTRARVASFYAWRSLSNWLEAHPMTPPRLRAWAYDRLLHAWARAWRDVERPDVARARQETIRPPGVTGPGGDA